MLEFLLLIVLALVSVVLAVCFHTLWAAGSFFIAYFVLRLAQYLSCRNLVNDWAKGLGHTVLHLQRPFSVETGAFSFRSLDCYIVTLIDSAGQKREVSVWISGFFFMLFSCEIRVGEDLNR